MKMYDIISQKKYGKSLSDAQIDFFIRGYTKGEIPHEQASALLMAIYFSGMKEQEIFALTDAMAHSGEVLDLSSIDGITVDKHSTGGVGDKTTLVVGPIVSACGLYMAKMAGRGLGHTGGTIDKLSSIPGLTTSLEPNRFLEITRATGFCIAGQSSSLAPADKKLYALRDITATVDSLPLIAASVMSKKIAAGASCILLDVKMGSGAFMQTEKMAQQLADMMERIGKNAGRACEAVISPMHQPLGNAIGNSLEVIEAIRTLKGEGPADLTQECIFLSAKILHLAGVGDMDACTKKATHALASGKAFERLCMMVEAQGGDARSIHHPSLLPSAKVILPLIAKQSGVLEKCDALSCGLAAAALGAGRTKIEDEIDYSAGIVLHKKEGDAVFAGETLLQMHTSSKALADAAEAYLNEGIKVRFEK